ncbi:MAG: hypothetical protein HYW71_02790 [Candidatus Niyogibacteria bacterium]|nr:hypothetical protein [Candidatus Niyogibacteria bacterium]
MKATAMFREAEQARRGRKKFPSGNLFVTKSSPAHNEHGELAREANKLLCSREDLKAERCSAKRNKRGGVAKNFRQEIYL